MTEKTHERQQYKSCEGTQLSVQFLRDLSVGVCDDGIKSRLLVYSPTVSSCRSSLCHCAAGVNIFSLMPVCRAAACPVLLPSEQVVNTHILTQNTHTQSFLHLPKCFKQRASSLHKVATVMLSSCEKCQVWFSSHLSRAAFETWMFSSDGVQ